jgi:predicted lipid-binding transport protein (Tim44 family)
MRAPLTCPQQPTAQGPGATELAPTARGAGPARGLWGGFFKVLGLGCLTEQVFVGKVEAVRGGWCTQPFE